MDILNIIKKNLPEGTLDSVAGSAGVDTDMVGNILKQAGPKVAGALGKKMEDDETFLEKAEEKTEGGLLDMVLGSQVEGVAEGVAKKFGISAGIVKTVLDKILPYIVNAIKGGKISPAMLTAAAGLADGVDVGDIKNIAGAFMGGKDKGDDNDNDKKDGGIMGMIGGILGGK